MRRPFGFLIVVALLHLFAPHVTSQSAQLRVVDAGPRGELSQLQQANEIRIVFSEPMVSLGRVPSNPTPAWIRISPAIRGTYRWSGTTILIFTPDPDTPLPHATTFTVTVDASATSAAGRRLDTPYEFTVTTPTVRLTSMRWYRRDSRFDRPVVLMLRFNQRVRPADIAAHATARFAPHDWTAPEMSARERARLAATDAAGLRAFDAKVASARQAASRSDAIGLRVTDDWDRERFPAGDDLVALETTTVPPPGTHLELTLDNTTPGIEGPARPPQAQRSVAELTPVFFAQGFACTEECNPSRYNGVSFTSSVSVAKFADALSVRDITGPGAEQSLARQTTVAATRLDEAWSAGIEDAGYERQPPATTFAYRIDPALEAADGQRLDYPWIGIVQNWRELAFTSFGDGHGVWEQGGGPELPFYSRNFQNVRQWFTRLLPADLMPRILALEQQNFRALPPGTGTLRQLNVTPDATQSYGMNLQPVIPDGTGLIWAGVDPGTPIPMSNPAVSADNDSRSAIVQVTNLGISVKDSPQSTLVFVTRLDNGEPVSGAEVAIVNTENRQLWRGTTANDGVAMAPALPIRDPDNWYRLSFIVTAEKDGDVAYVASDWNEGIMPWDFGYGYQLWESTDILRGTVFTDRGVYRPGEEVHAKIIARIDTPNGIRLLPAGSQLDVRVRDSRNREVDTRTLTVNRWSSTEWAWTVPASSTLGDYSVEVALPSAQQQQPPGNDVTPETRREQAEWLRQISGRFLVAAYRRPDFRVDTTFVAGAPVAGATLSGRLEARYLFGNAMPNRPVRWSIVRQPDLTIPSAIRERFPEERYAFGYYPRSLSNPERIAGAEATLDASGAVAVEAASARDVDFAYRYTFEGDVEDVSRQRLANRSSLVIHPAPWYVGLRRPGYFADVAAGTSVDVVVANLEGNAVADVPVTVALTRVQWNSVRRAEGGGFYTWDTEEIRTPAGQWTVTSATTPIEVSMPLTDGGYYVIAATARDADGRTTRTETSFYALGRGYTAWQRYDHNRITLEPEKKTWKPGETARLMIQSPWESATALLTVEREGVRRHERFTLTSTQQTVLVPITEDDIPNVYVSVLLVRGRTSDDPGADGSDPGKPAFKLGYAELSVEDASKRLSVSVTADRAEYRPANTARVSVAVTDASSRPTAGEVTLWAVDYGVLSLTGYNAPDVLGSVYQHKALQVMNADSRQRIVSRRVLTPKGEGEGGGGGMESTARRDFRPLAFWLGSVETDENGTATREVTLPEPLTTYRIMAVAADTGSRFGSASAEIKVNKPVTLLAAFPRFLALGDRASFGAVVTNTLSSGGRATVTIRSLDPAILQFQGGSSRTFQLGAGATEPVRFDATARGVGAARVLMTVRLGNETDAFEMTLPVSAPAPMETSAAFGDTESRAVERLSVPAGVLPGLGGLNVELSSTALVGLGEGARYLADYPFACAEQKASAALALTLAADLGSVFAMGRIAPSEYRARASALVSEMSRFQCENGGFAYWPGGCAAVNVYLTSYVLHVMRIAGTLGIEVNADSVDRGLNFLEEELKRTVPPGQVQWLPVWSASQAFAVKVLAEHRRNQDSNITRLLSMADRLPVFAQSYLADALHASAPGTARYNDLVRRISNAIRVEGDRAHVQEVDDDELRWLWNSNVRTSAIVLDGLVRRGDDATHVPGLVRWLLAAREDGRWGNTQENATALESLVAYYRKFESEEPNMTATVSVASRAIGTAAFRGRSSAVRQVQLAMPDLLRRVPAGAERELAVARAGTGRVYYSTRLQYAPRTPPDAAEQGIRVERRYERFVENGESPAATTFEAGDLIRVTLAITLPQERRFVAVTDPLVGGVEAVDAWFQTTASDLARDASVSNSGGATGWWWERGGFDYVEKHDDRVTLFATRLAQGRHEFSYLVRATTSGTFRAAGTTAEEMYAPEVKGRSAPAVVEIR